MKLLFLCTALLYGIIGFTQSVNIKPPIYSVIKKNIVKEKSNFYYPKLIEKYNSADSTMTLKEKRHLYYGYIHHPKYSPYSRSDYTDSLRIVLKKRMYSPIDLKNIATYADSLLVQNPFNLKAIHYKIYVFNQLEDAVNLKKEYAKMRMLTDALLSSGDGLTKKTAFYVISPTHEYSLLNILGYDFGGKQSLIEHFDYLTLKENDENIEGLYFDVSASLEHMNNLFKN